MTNDDGRKLEGALDPSPKARVSLRPVIKNAVMFLVFCPFRQSLEPIPKVVGVRHG